MNSRRTETYFQSASDDSVRAPQTRMPRSGKLRITLTPRGFSVSCVSIVDREAHVECAADDRVRRRLEHAALGVGPRVDAEHVPAWRHERRGAGLRIRDADPGRIKRREGAVPLVEAARIEARRLGVAVAVDDGETEPLPLAVIDDLPDDRRAVVRRVRRVDERDVAIRVELEREQVPESSNRPLVLSPRKSSAPITA